MSRHDQILVAKCRSNKNIRRVHWCLSAVERHSVGMKLVMKIEDTMMLKDFKQSVSHNLSDVFVLELLLLSLRAVRILRGK